MEPAPPRRKHRCRRRAAALAIVALALGGARETIGIHGAWGAYRSDGRCYAIAAPLRAGGVSPWRPWAGVVGPMGRDRRNAIVLRLSLARALPAPITLAIGERRFRLSGNATTAWTPDAATDHAVIAAMRGGRSMSVSTLTVAGRPFADSYRLAGAATAIDAARLACA